MKNSMQGLKTDLTLYGVVFASILVTLMLLFTDQANAASSKKRTTVKMAAPASPPPAAPSTPRESENHASSSGFKPSAGFYMGSISSKFHLGTLGKIETPTRIGGAPFKLGARTGFLLGLSSPTDFVIPFLIAGTYEFPENHSGLKPTLGLELGFSLTHVSYSGTSNTSFDFAGLIVPGLNLNHKYFVEVPFGVLATDFAFMPGIGMRF